MIKKNIFLIAISLISIGISYDFVNAEAQIIIDPITKTITITGINLNTGATNTGGIQTVTTQTGTNPTPNTQNSTQIGLNTTGTEFERALSWMYANGLTKYDNQTDYRMYDALTREEAAKMFSEAYNVLNYTKEIRNSNCNFNDKGNFNSELIPFIQNVCQRGIIKGFNNNYMPTKQLTRPEAMAILIRMFEGKASFENQQPRRSDYYLKGKAIGLTTLNNNSFEKEISRYEIALYIYRLQTIATNNSLKAQSQLTLQNLTGIVQTGLITSPNQSGYQESSSELAQKFSAIANSISVEKDPELQEAIRWMHDNGLTNFSTIGEYKPFEVLTREQSAKIFDIFAKIFSFSQEKLNATLPTDCQFSDISKADQTLVSNIQNVCKMEILKGGNKLFDPKNTLTKGQFITALIRLVEGKKLDETKNPRWTSYYQSALDMGIVGPADAITFDSSITRYEVALFLYRFRIKFQLINNLNTNTLENMIFSSVPGTIKTTNPILSGEKAEFNESDIFIDTNLIQNANFELGYIEINNTKHKVIRTSTETYFNKNFVRYGDIYDISDNSKIGTINFIVSNRTILEGTVRINDKSYIISQVPNTTAYYQIKKN